MYVQVKVYTFICQFNAFYLESLSYFSVKFYQGDMCSTLSNPRLLLMTEAKHESLNQVSLTESDVNVALLFAYAVCCVGDFKGKALHTFVCTLP